MMDRLLNVFRVTCDWCGQPRWFWNVRYVFSEGPFCKHDCNDTA